MKDALRSETLQPGSYAGKCVSYEPATAKGDGSAVHKFGIEVAHNGIDFPLQDFVISEKAVSMGKAFFIACGFPREEWDKLVKGQATSAQIDPNECVGKAFKVQVINDKYENRILNKAGDFFSLQ